MRTIEQIEKVHALIRKYRALKEKLKQARCIVGGYLHYENYSATLIDSDIAKDVRQVIVHRYLAEIRVILYDLKAFDIDVSEEFREP